jgi:cobyrinic acid a,c-diamide synthase
MRRHDESVRRIVDKNGASHRFGGLLPGRSVMQKRLAALGTQFADLPEGRLAGHTFHYSTCETALTPLHRAVAAKG